MQFDAGSYTEKRALATEIVQIIRSLTPPGRFLKKVTKKEDADAANVIEGGEWEELSDDKAIHKACQVMRDIDRPDRKDRELRRAAKKQKKLEGKTGAAVAAGVTAETVDDPEKAAAIVAAAAEKASEEKGDSSAEKAAVAEAVAATEEALDKALDAATDASPKKQTVMMV